MCGICGYIKLNDVDQLNQRELLKMTNTMQHRGPDDIGYHSDKNLFLGMETSAYTDGCSIEQKDKHLMIIFKNKLTTIATSKVTSKDVNENFYKDPAYDLYLMSLCKHFVLAPSSMHYWAAFLSTNANKVCLSPSNIKNRSGYYGFSNNKDIRPDWWKET